MKAIKYCTRAELKDSSLAFSEKFTILHKVIANTLNIERPREEYRINSASNSNNLAKFCQYIYTPPDSKVDVVVIDAGHGGHDDGTHGKVIERKRCRAEHCT